MVMLSVWVTVKRNLLALRLSKLDHKTTVSHSTKVISHQLSCEAGKQLPVCTQSTPQ